MDTTQPRLRTSNLKFMRDPISTIVATGSGHLTDSAWNTPSIWIRETSWLPRMEANAKLSIFLAWFSLTPKQYTHHNSPNTRTPAPTSKPKSGPVHACEVRTQNSSDVTQFQKQPSTQLFYLLAFPHQLLRTQENQR